MNTITQKGMSPKIYKSIFPNCTCPLVKQFKKVCKSTAVQCYKCFSLLSMLLLVFIASLLARVKWLEQNNNKKLTCSVANCGGLQ